MTKEVWYLPVEKPPEGWRTDYPVIGYVPKNGWQLGSTHRVLGPPVPALPDPLSPEARAVLEAAPAYVAGFARAGSDALAATGTMIEACRAYAASLAPPDPLREAREALADLQRLHYSGSRMFIIDRLSAALDRLAEQGGAP